MDPLNGPALAARLLPWFSHHRRDLPFRRRRTPYRVLLSEVMSQQTAAEAVGPFLERFEARYPDIGALAAADPQEVLALWQGLGYYSRARNLLLAAGAVVQRHGGKIPEDPVQLQALPGVGPYIAGAVASLAFGRDVAAFDANARRVLSRLGDAPATAELAQSLVPPGRAAEWNEAIMDLGALVCVPRVPRCALCPLRELCAGHRAGRAAEWPVRAPRRTRPEVLVTTLVAYDAAGRLGLVQRAAGGLLGDLWECPSVEAQVVPEEVAVRHGLVLRSAVTCLPPLRHVFTHRIWRIQPYRAEVAGALRWVEAAELPGVPLGGPAARLLAAEGAAAPPAN